MIQYHYIAFWHSKFNELNTALLWFLEAELNWCIKGTKWRRIWCLFVTYDLTSKLTNFMGPNNCNLVFERADLVGLP
jgi:hypothetical protein